VAGLGVLAVDALSLDEALLLARELPHLRALIQGELAGVEPEVARRLALGVLNVAQGHPKLLELADGQAGDPGRLAALVAAGDQAWQQAGGLPEGFFTAGESRAAGRDYLGVLAAWTDAVAGGLAAGVRTVFWFVCCLEVGKVTGSGRCWRGTGPTCGTGWAGRANRRIWTRRWPCWPHEG
jgi:hypothetical protein